MTQHMLISYSRSTRPTVYTVESTTVLLYFTRVNWVEPFKCHYHMDCLICCWSPCPFSPHFYHGYACMSLKWCVCDLKQWIVQYLIEYCTVAVKNECALVSVYVAQYIEEGSDWVLDSRVCTMGAFYGWWEEKSFVHTWVMSQERRVHCRPPFEHLCTYTGNRWLTWPDLNLYRVYTDPVRFGYQFGNGYKT